MPGDPKENLGNGVRSVETKNSLLLGNRGGREKKSTGEKKREGF